MEKQLKLKLAVVGVVLLVVGVLVVSRVARDKEQLDVPVGMSVEVNTLSQGVHSSTSTGTRLPVLLLARDQKRIYFVCESSPANTVNVGIHFQNFGSSTASLGSAALVASGVVSATGSLLLVPGGSYESLPENTIVDEVWSTSTLSGQVILCFSK